MTVTAFAGRVQGGVIGFSRGERSRSHLQVSRRGDEDDTKTFVISRVDFRGYDPSVVRLRRRTPLQYCVAAPRNIAAAL